MWLSNHDDDSRWAAFAAYEKLDNVDYNDLHNLVKNFELPQNALAFFLVHTKVEHFEAAEKELSEIWQKNPEQVKDAFNFIGTHQNEMWQNLSDAIYNLGNNQLH